ncbi:MAG TPA: DciA family protein [Candidatus Eremiobacteraceae bacterium]|nr:DciA family protein [Candidatus Eremiobacteraceae bacterium]
MSGPRSLKSLLAGWTPHAGYRRSGGAEDQASAAFAAAWEQTVGSDVARRSRPTKFHHGVLTVLTASSAWSDELSLHSPRIIVALQRAFPDQRLQRLRFMVASGRTKMLLDGERSRASAATQPPAAAPPAARTASHGAQAEALDATLVRIAAQQHALDEARDRAGWTICTSCERRFLPQSRKAVLCAPCADSKRRSAQAAIERALMHAPWLSFADLRRALPHSTSTAYERARLRLLTRWQSDIEAAQRRLRRAQLCAEDRVVTWSYLMLVTGLAQRDIGRAVVMDILGREWMIALFGDAVAQKQEARRSPREKHMH